MSTSKAPEPMEVEAKDPPKDEQPVHTLLREIRDTLAALDRAVTNKETRTISKLTKQVRRYRKVIKPHHIFAIYETIDLPLNSDLLKRCKDYNEGFNEKFDDKKILAPKIQRVIELEAFIRILVISIWWRELKFGECLQAVAQLLKQLTAANKRSLDNYTALLCFYLSRLHEKNNSDVQLRENLLQSYNHACVRGDQIGQSTLLNLLLRNYLRQNHIEAAYNLIEKTSFPQNKSNNEFCKYLFYTGKVKAIRREYVDALNRLNQAIRKAPDSAFGFKIHCQKVAIVVELLQGDIPSRQIFSDTKMFSNVYAYFKLIQVVLEGDLEKFNNTVQLYASTYQKDKLYTMVLRLNQIVIRIGLRRISLAYSRISMSDIAVKLSISAEDVEFVVAKALRDGVMGGEIDHQARVLNISGDANVYVTNEPQQSLNKRIQYCLNLYHETQKAITYPEFKGKLKKTDEEEDLGDEEILNLLDLDQDM